MFSPLGNYNPLADCSEYFLQNWCFSGRQDQRLAIYIYQEARPELPVITLNIIYILSKFSQVEGIYDL